MISTMITLYGGIIFVQGKLLPGLSITLFILLLNYLNEHGCELFYNSLEHHLNGGQFFE